jgi:hypothetical protein
MNAAGGRRCVSSRRELNVTQWWLLRAMSDQCFGSSGRLVFTEMKMILDMLLSKKTNNVHRCVWDPEQPVIAAICDVVVATEFHVANGMTSDPDGRGSLYLRCGCWR